MLNKTEIEEFTTISGNEGLIKFLNMPKDDLIRLLFSEMNLKNKAYFYLVDNDLMTDFNRYKPVFAEN